MNKIFYSALFTRNMFKGALHNMYSYKGTSSSYASSVKVYDLTRGTDWKKITRSEGELLDTGTPAICLALT